MNAIIRSACLLVVLSRMSTTALAGDVNTDFNPNTDFSKYRTYSWLKLQMPNSIWEQRARTAIDNVLAARGLRLVQTGGDIVLVANGTTATKTELSTFYSGMDGWGWYGWGPRAAYTEPIQYAQGTLIVDMFDAQTKQLLWRGVATETLSDKPEKNTEKFDKAVEKMFRKFPPEPK